MILDKTKTKRLPSTAHSLKFLRVFMKDSVLER